MKRNLIVLMAVVSGASVLGGCGFVHNKFGRKAPAYSNAVEARPLEVPPDLDTPNHSAALVVPPRSTAAVDAVKPTPPMASAATPPGAAPPAAVAAPAAAATPGVALGGDGLHVADSADSTWSRVGLALERSGAAVILARDATAHTYTVETTGQTTTKPGFLKRVVTFGRAGNRTTAKVQLTIEVNPAAANASTVSVEGAQTDEARAAAQALMTTLRERLS